MNREQMVDKVARTLAGLVEGEEWPTNELLGGGLTGTRDDEYRDGLHEEAREVLDAILPQITTVTELDALPLGTKAIAKTGRVWWRSGQVWRCETGLVRRSEGLTGHGPFTVVWQPEVNK